jgi:hypothetical protein
MTLLYERLTVARDVLQTPDTSYGRLTRFTDGLQKRDMVRRMEDGVGACLTPGWLIFTGCT